MQTPRVTIIDFNHLAHRFLRGAKPLYISVLVDGEQKRLNTTIPAYSLKFITKVSNKGINPTCVCFDRPTPARKAYFSSLTQVQKDGTKTPMAYKDGRSSSGSDFFDGVKWTETILQESGVATLSKYNYEADDLIFTAVQYAKQHYPNYPIDVITGDGDLLPLVDEQVNVYMRSTLYTLSEEGSPELNKYVQVTKNNFKDAIKYITAFRDYDLPYNGTLLVKLLRGDSADNLKPIHKFTPTKMKKLLADLQEAGVDFGTLCRYGGNRKVWVNSLFPNDRRYWSDSEQPNLVPAYLDSAEIKHTIDVLKPYLEVDILKQILSRYRGMNLNNNLNGRPPYPITNFSTYEYTLLRSTAYQKLRISL